MTARSSYHQGTPTDVRRRRLLRAAKEELRRLKAARKKGWTVSSVELSRARAAIAAHARRDPKKSSRTTGRVPPSTYYKSGSSFPRLKKPSAKLLTSLTISRVQRGTGRQWLVEFSDGMGVNVHASDSGRFYALKVHDRVRYYDEARPEPSGALKHAYQYAALVKIVPHQSAFHIDATGNVFADVHDDLAPWGRDAAGRKRRTIRRGTR